MAFNPTIHSYSPLWSHEPGDTPWWRGRRRLRSNLIGDDHQSVSLQIIENKALSWGIIRKSACIHDEITIWKSQERQLAPMHPLSRVPPPVRAPRGRYAPGCLPPP